MLKKLTASITLVLTILHLSTLISISFAALPPNFEKTNLINSNLESPTSLEVAPDGRIFIAELEGKIKIYKNGQLLSAVFAELPALAMNDRGLLGMTLDPDFMSNKYIYLYYVDENDSFHKIVRLTAATDVATEQTLIYSTQKVAAELHAGGGIDFGPDGKLYVSIGDSGPSTNAQDISVPLGKVLRMNKDGSIPSDNPFFGMVDRNQYIWAYGFRNPFRMQFDNISGKLYLGDVGYQSWEEINLIEKGKNYGWAKAEGDCGSCPYTNPIYQYGTSGGASVIIGPTYQGTNFPSGYRGSLFFGDYVKGFIRTLSFNPDNSVSQLSDFETSKDAGSVIDIKEGLDGAIYYLTIFPGGLYKIIYTTENKAPISVASSNVTGGSVPLTVQFSATSTDPEGDLLTYKWNFGDGTESMEQNPTKTYNSTGKFSVILTTSDASHSSDSPPIEIQAGIPPEITIDKPTEGSKYKAGDIIEYSATAINSSGSSLPESSITREIIFHHNIHIHPFLHEANTTQGNFSIPKTGEADADQWYEIKFKATDSNGLITTKSVNIFPLKSDITFATDPAGLSILLNGSPYTTPITRTGVIGFTNTVSVIAQEVNGSSYEFDHWSDGGIQTHTIDVPETPTTYTAYFKAPNPPSPSPTPTILPLEFSDFKGEYFNNLSFDGEPVFTRNDPVVDFRWSRGTAPGPNFPDDQFSVRWVTEEDLELGVHQFEVWTDDGVRLYIDDHLILDKWFDQPQTYYFVDKYLAAGKHKIKLEYYEAFGGAIIKLNHKKLSDAFEAQYFDNQELQGIPVATRLEPYINLILNYQAPADGVPMDHYSARWIKKQYFATEKNYSFTIKSDDGARFWIDNNLIVNDWSDHSMRTYTPTVFLSEGVHTLKVEYYENFGTSVISLNQDNY